MRFDQDSLVADQDQPEAESEPRRRRRRNRGHKLTDAEVRAILRGVASGPADWPTCPGCGSQFLPSTGRVLKALPFYGRWAGKPCCSSACRIVVQLLGPIDQALLDPAQALNTNLGRLLTSIAGYMRRNLHRQQAEVAPIGIQTAARVEAPYLNDRHRELLRARSRQLYYISKGLYNRSGRRFRRRVRNTEGTGDEAGAAEADLTDWSEEST